MAAPVTSLLTSRSHSTVLATAVQRSQSPALKFTVENAYCMNGRFTTATCDESESRSAPHNHLFENIPMNALRSSERALNTVKIAISTNVVNAVVCAYPSPR